MSEFYSASDYAGIIGGDYEFYYGYESALKIQSDCCDEPCTCDSPWRFTVTKNEKEIWAATSEELGEDNWECARVLMAGVGAWLDHEKEGS